MQAVGRADAGGPSQAHRRSVLGFCIDNVVGHYDARNNVYPRRETPDKKIHSAIAAIIALGVSIAAEKDGDVYIYTDTDLLVF